MFGIKGIRWKNPQIALDVGLPEDCYLKYFSNPAWVSPDAYRTVHSDKVENNCYWLTYVCFTSINHEDIQKISFSCMEDIGCKL